MHNALVRIVLNFALDSEGLSLTLRAFINLLTYLLTYLPKSSIESRLYSACCGQSAAFISADVYKIQTGSANLTITRDCEDVVKGCVPLTAVA